MGLLTPDTSIYQDAPRSVLNYGLQGFDQGMQSLAQMQKQKDDRLQYQQNAAAAKRQQDFQKAFQGLVQVNGTHPEGMQKTVQDLGTLGFGQEAYELASKLPQPKEKSYQSVSTDRGFAPFDPQTGTYGSPAKGADGAPLYAPDVAAKMQTGKADFNFGKAIPTYEAALRSIGSDVTKRDLLASKIMAEHPDSPKAEKYIQTVLKTQSPFSLTAAPPSGNDKDKWVDFLVNKGDYQTFMQGMSGIRGPARQGAIVDILARAKAKDPNFDVVGAKAGIKQAEDGTNNKVLNLINGVLPNMQHLIALSDKIKRSGVKVVSKAQLAASRQFSDEDLANFDVMKTLTGDEINQIFAGGKGGSDMSRHMALDLINETLPPEKFASTMKTIYGAMQNRANGIRSGFNGYGGQSAQPKSDVMPAAAGAGAIAQPKSKAEKDALPPGTRYIGPDGKVAIKQ